MKKVGLLICVCAALSAQAGAREIVFRNGTVNALSGGAEYEGTEDIGIRSAGPGLTYNNNRVIVGRTGIGSGEDKMLLRFDLTSLTSGVPAGKKIQVKSATLFYSKPDSESLTGNQTLSIHQISSANAGWAEDVSTWNAMEPRVKGWAGSAGLSTADVDYNSSVVATERVRAAAQTFNTKLPVDMVQRWVDNPADNAGLLFTMMDVPQGEFIFIYSSEWSGSRHRPALTIDYEVR